MNHFNRLLVSLSSLALIGVALLVLAVALGLVRPDDVLRQPWSHLLEPAWLAEGTDWRWLVGVSVALIPVCLGLFILQWTGLRREAPEIALRTAAGGAVTVAQRSVRQLADRLGRESPGVLEIHTRVSGLRDGLRIVGRVAVDPDHSLPEVAEDLQARIKTGIEKAIGVSVSEVRVNAHLGARAASRPRTSRVE